MKRQAIKSYQSVQHLKYYQLTIHSNVPRRRIPIERSNPKMVWRVMCLSLTALEIKQQSLKKNIILFPLN